MTSNRNDPQVVEAEIAALSALDLPALRDRWHQLFGNPAPKSLRHAFLVKAVAFQIQVKVFGGLSAATKRHLREVAQAARTGAAVPAVPKVKPGTQLLRQWQGTTHTVTVLEKGFEWNGRRFGSLSAVAKALTGGTTNWNGPVFFGLKRVPVANKNAAGSREEHTHV